jgi:hypothetical protein
MYLFRGSTIGEIAKNLHEQKQIGNCHVKLKIFSLSMKGTMEALVFTKNCEQKV